MKKLKVGVVGCGGIFKGAHRPAYLKMEDVEIVALCDIIPEHAERFLPEFPGAKLYTDYKEMIDTADIEAVDICTPNYMHAPIAVYALNAGKHAFSEKPDSIRPELVEGMRDAANAAGKTLMVMRNNRFVPCSQYAKKYIEEGNMGEIYAAHCAWKRRRGIPGKGGWFTTKEQSGGGPLIDLGVHMIDLALWLMGSPRPVAVTGCTYEKFANNDVQDSVNSHFGNREANGTFDVEDLAMGFVRLENGACLSIEFSWASNVEGETRYVELYGTKSGMKWQDENLTLFEEKNGILQDVAPRFPKGVSGHEMNLRNYRDVILYGAEPCYKPQQGIDMVKLLCALYESARVGHEILL